MFQVPGKPEGGSSFFRVNIIIEALNEHFYPKIYIKRFEADTQPLEFSVMNYPSLNDYDDSFGENPFDLLNKNKFVWSFEGTSTRKWSYYTMVIYEHNWGLTDDRKSEY